MASSLENVEAILQWLHLSRATSFINIKEGFLALHSPTVATFQVRIKTMVVRVININFTNNNSTAGYKKNSWA